MTQTLADLRRAHSVIEDDLTELLCATGVLDLAHSELTQGGAYKGDSSVSQSLHFTSRSIEAIVRRIEGKLSGEAAPAEPPCARDQEAHQ